MSDQIKIHLVSVLDEAGYKQTDKKTKETARSVREEIDRILKKRAEYERSVEGMAKKTIADMDKEKNQAEALKNKLAELPGPIGKITSEWMKAHSGFTKFAGKAMSVIAAFKVGWDIGTWINDKVITPLLGIKDPIEELKKAHRKAAKEAEESARKWTEAQDRYIEGLDRESRRLDDGIARINKKTQAYIRLQNAQKAVSDANGDTELLSLQRDKFDDMLSLHRGGYIEAEAQVGKYYDVLIAEQKAKSRIADIDQKIVDLEKEQAGEADKIRASRIRESVALDKLNEIQRRKNALDENDSETWVNWGDNYNAAMKKLERMEDKAKANLTKAERTRLDAEESSKLKTIQRKELEIRKENIVIANELELDEKRKAYDSYLEEVEKKEAERAEEESRRKMELVKEEENRRREMERRLMDERIRDMQKEMSERSKAQSEANARLQNASGSLSTAWGWYRNQSSMQAVIDEQKAQQEAEKQWAKDFDRLKSHHRDWRDIEFGKLSASEESVRQVALAKEEKAAAEKAVIETAENTRQLAEKLDELLQVKG